MVEMQRQVCAYELPAAEGSVPGLSQGAVTEAQEAVRHLEFALLEA